MNDTAKQPEAPVKNAATRAVEASATLMAVLGEKAPAMVEAVAPVLAEKDTSIRQLEFKLMRMEAMLRSQVRARFGSRSEAIDPKTLLPYASLAEMLAAGEAASEQAKAEQAAQTEEPAAPKSKPKRQPLPASLERVIIPHTLPESERKCPCCGETTCKMGEETSERIQYIPSQVFIEVHVEEKYACPTCRNNGCGKCGCEGQILQAQKTPQAIEKSSAGSGILALIATGKYADHLPLNRQEDILRRHGIDLGRSTTCGWMMQLMELFVPLVEMLKAEILASLVVQMDDTPVKMLEPGKGKTKETRCWPYQGDEKHRFIVFDFQENRNHEHPENWFKNADFTGREMHGQCDGYQAYNRLGDKDRAGGPVILLGCMAHMRRYFIEAENNGKGDKRANEMLFLIQKLYRVEKEAKAEAGFGPKDPTHVGAEGVTAEKVDKLWAARKRLRTQSLEILEKQIKPWLDAMKLKSEPRSRMGEAVTYALNQWPRLLEYTKHGHLEIDNNAIERGLRCVAIGRKNWEFVGSERGGRALCVFSSVIASAKLHGLDVFEYLRDLIEKLPILREAGWPNDELRKFLPDQWTPPAK